MAHKKSSKHFRDHHQDMDSDYVMLLKLKLAKVPLCGVIKQ